MVVARVARSESASFLRQKSIVRRRPSFKLTLHGVRNARQRDNSDPYTLAALLFLLSGLLACYDPFDTPS